MHGRKRDVVFRSPKPEAVSVMAECGYLEQQKLFKTDLFPYFLMPVCITMAISCVSHRAL